MATCNCTGQCRDGKGCGGTKFQEKEPIRIIDEWLREIDEEEREALNDDF